MSYFKCRFAAWKNRLIAGFLLALLSYLYSVCYDMPGSLQITLQNTFRISTYQFEYLYSFYSFPNIGLVFFNGLLLDRWLGLELGIFIFSLFELLGQIIVTVGGFTQQFWVLLVGRVVYGLGAESLVLAVNCYLVIWFIGNEINLFNAVCASIVKLGTATVFLFSVPLYESFNSRYSLGFTELVFCFIVLLSLISVIVLGKHTRRSCKVEEKCHDNVNVSHIIKFPVTFWFNNVTVCLVTASIISFTSLFQGYMFDRYGYSLAESNRLSGFFNLVGGLSPILPGILADYIGYEMYFILFGVFSGFFAQILFLLNGISVYLPLVLFAFSFGIVNSICWSATAFAVESYQLATALGVAICLVDFCNSVFPILAGYLLERFGLDSIFILFLAMYVISLVFTILTILIDMRRSRVLVMSSKERRVLLEKRDATTGK